MNFIEDILHRLHRQAARPVLQEVRDRRIVPVTAGELSSLVRTARSFLVKSGIRRGDRCALLAPNSIHWVAMDLAIVAEGAIVVPLYARQSPAEIVAMMQDCEPALICCGSLELGEAIRKAWADAPRIYLFEDIFGEGTNGPVPSDPPVPLTNDDPVTIIYTSGTSGRSKGVILCVGNINFMLGCTNDRLDLLMGGRVESERVFHYLPFCFAGSWILLLTCLTRQSVLTMSTDLNKLADELKLAAPHYFLNVPVLLERIRAGVEDQIRKKGGLAKAVFNKGKAAYFRQSGGDSHLVDALWLAAARSLIFRAIRKKLGADLRALICGSAPLATETQRFFMMLGIPVLQVYGLTETTAICTMDDPHHVVPGRVGPAIPGIEMKLGEANEILVRGPNVFPGYWNQPQETAKTFTDGWFNTGDQGDVDAQGNWSITGRVKNLIIPASGHNIAPEPIEESLLRAIPGAQQVILIGNGRKFLSAIVTGDVAPSDVERALEIVNPELPHYKRVRAYYIHRDPCTAENGLLTANGKLKRDAIARRFKAEIEELYLAAESGRSEEEKSKRGA
jgi:long-chain acyl-CoA synthetase